jgi:hypothetical protein
MSIGERSNAFGIGVTKTVDGLVVVAHHRERSGDRQDIDKGLVRLVEILVFVDEHRIVGGQDGSMWVLLKEPQCDRNQFSN